MIWLVDAQNRKSRHSNHIRKKSTLYVHTITLNIVHIEVRIAFPILGLVRPFKLVSRKL